VGCFEGCEDGCWEGSVLGRETGCVAWSLTMKDKRWQCVAQSSSGKFSFSAKKTPVGEKPTLFTANPNSNPHDMMQFTGGRASIRWSEIDRFAPAQNSNLIALTVG
jgi:hypothetical protein